MTPNEAPSKSNAVGGVRGSCQRCGKDVYDTQPRFKDPDSGLYQHQDCQAAGTAEPEAAARTGMVVSNLAEVKQKATGDVETAQAEVAAILAAIADAKQQAVATLARAEADAAKAKEDAAAAAAARTKILADARQQAEADAAKTNEAASRTKALADAKQHVDATLAQAEADAGKTKEEAAATFSSATNAADFDDATSSTSLTSAATTPSTAVSTPKPLLLPVAPKVKALLPGGQHAFLSYQWDVQEQVKEIKGMLNERQIKCTDVFIF